MERKDRSPAGLYIHVPFCRSRCAFCDFVSTTDRSRAGDFLDALEREMDLRAPSWPFPFDTVYLGGGTPSLLGPDAAARILAAARSRFAVDRAAEVTLEANPGDLERPHMEALLRAGVTRLSLGVQSFDDRDLAFLGRSHSVRDSLDSYRSAREAGFRNISIDLIYGLPGCPRDRWGETIARATALGPDHISAYALTLEPGEAVLRRLRESEIEADAEDEALDLFLFTRSRLEEAGYRQFEVSSFPRSEEHESRHNRKYWEGAPYLGLGPSAHSHRGAERRWNVPRLDDYVDSLRSGRDPLSGREELGCGQRMLESIFLGLRLVRGLDLDAFSEEFGLDLRDERRDALDLLAGEELGTIEGSVLRLSPRGLALADSIALRLAPPEL